MNPECHSFDGRLNPAGKDHWPILKPMGLLLSALAVSAGLFLGACQLLEKPSDPWQEVKKRGHVIVGVNYGNAPFGLYTAEGNRYVLKGLEVDLSNAIASRLFPGEKSPVRFRQVLTSTRLAALNTKGVDMIAASMSITPNRKQRVSFSVPYFAVHQKILLPLESPVKSIEDLDGKTVLTINGSTAQSRLQKQFPKIKVKGYATLHDAFAALQQKEGDALSNDDVLLKGLLQKNCFIARHFRFLPDDLSTEYYGLVFQKSDAKNANTLLKKVDAILGEMSQDGSLETIKNRWTQFDCL